MPMLVMTQRLRGDGKTVACVFLLRVSQHTHRTHRTHRMHRMHRRTGWAGSEGRGQHGQGVDFGLCRMKYFTVLVELGLN